MGKYLETSIERSSFEIMGKVQVLDLKRNQNIDSEKKEEEKCMPKLNMSVLESYSIANKKACKHNKKNM